MQHISICHQSANENFAIIIVSQREHVKLADNYTDRNVTNAICTSNMK